MRWRRFGVRLGCAIAAPVIAFGAAVRFVPYPDSLAERPISAMWIVDRHRTPLATLVAEDGSLNRWVDPDELGPYLANAIVAVEDERFFEHGAIDWRSIAGAAASDVHGLAAHRGASTITMQLARLREPLSHSLLGKAAQAFRAIQIERRESKQDILLDYINCAPFGGNLVGAGAASWRYFGKPPSALSLSQAALLAGLPQSPNGDRPDRHPDKAAARRNHVLTRMFACGMIDATQLRQAIAEPIDARWLPLPQANSSATLANGAMPTLIDMARHQSAGEVAVTIDSTVQEKTIGVVRPALETFNRDGSHAAAAVVVLDTATAECLAVVSLGDRLGLDLTHRERSTGSVLKPFIYAAAFQANLASPRSIMNDAPTAWAGYEPRNFDHSFCGQIDADAALAESRNLPAMILLAHVGVGDMTRTLGSLGICSITSDRPVGLTLAVGGAEASAWEIAQAYATLARGGQSRQAAFIQDSPTASRMVFTRSACLAVLHSLSDSDRTHSICPSAALLGAAWKTGTSSGSRDAWCAAVTPRCTVVVWIGNASGASDIALKGVAIAAPIALNVLATVDPGGDAFEMPHDTHPAISQITTARHILTIAAPLDHQQFIVDPDIAPDQQQITFRAASDDVSTAPLWWFIDRTFIGTASANRAVSWIPQPGTHTLRVVSEAGTTATVRFAVNKPSVLSVSASSLTMPAP